MKRSKHRILTTHAGSLPRRERLLQVMRAKERGELSDQNLVDREIRDAVTAAVRLQVGAGVDVVSDGEMSKPSYATYVKERLTGFYGRGHFPVIADLAEFPAYAAREMGREALRELKTPSCTDSIRYIGHDAVQRDIDTLRSAIADANVEEAFLTAASPGVISLFLANERYPTHEAYLAALADAMRHEYEAIHASGLLLQVDCPDLAMGRHIQYAQLSTAEFRRRAALHVEALNHALENIPPDRVRMHVCWANYQGPHHHDVELSEIIDILLRAKPAGISFVAANPRHEHEWKVWKHVRLPEGRILIPGVIDSTTNFIEHPDLVAERIERFARIAGAQNVIAGTDCGFSTFAGLTTVDPAIAWAKLGALAEGARRASARVFRPRDRALTALVQSGQRATSRLRRLTQRNHPRTS